MALQQLHAALQGEGFQPLLGEDAVSFRYFGQPASVRLEGASPYPQATVTLRLPRPAPGDADTAAFNARSSLVRLLAQDGRAALSVSSLVSERDEGPMVLHLFSLLEQAAGELIFGNAATAAVPAAVSAQPAPVPPAATQPAAVQAAAARTAPEPPAPPVPPVPVSPAPSAADLVPPGWGELWPLMDARYHPLARELARLSVPVPADVQTDLVGGGKVQGTAVMQWGRVPNAVVVCEPGQHAPEGYRSRTWLRDFTAEQVALSVRHDLLSAGLM